MNTETGQSIPQDMSTEGVPEVEQEPQQDWFFTFGAGLPHDGRYVVIHGTKAAAREEMIAHFGNRWCDQYRTAERAGIDEYDLIVLPRAFWPEPTVAAPTSFEEQVAVHVRRLDAERTPVAAAEEHAGEDGQAVVLADIARLDRVVWEYTAARVQIRTGLTQQAADERLANAERLRLEIAGALGRIEAYVRGEQR